MHGRTTVCNHGLVVRYPRHLGLSRVPDISQATAPWLWRADGGRCYRAVTSAPKQGGNTTDGAVGNALPVGHVVHSTPS
jgi:hypothetical protein